MKVWISPYPGVAFPGFRLWKRLGVGRYLYRDLDGSCRKTILAWPTTDEVFER
jgi:hypothetical protein